jgi:hypothetical protein
MAPCRGGLGPFAFVPIFWERAGSSGPDCTREVAHMRTTLRIAATVALGLALSAGVLAPAAAASPATLSPARAADTCSDAKDQARGILDAVGRPTDSDDAEFLFNEMTWVFHNTGGTVREAARATAGTLSESCG